MVDKKKSDASTSEGTTAKRRTRRAAATTEDQAVVTPELDAVESIEVIETTEVTETADGTETIDIVGVVEVATMPEDGALEAAEAAAEDAEVAVLVEAAAAEIAAEIAAELAAEPLAEPSADAPAEPAVVWPVAETTTSLLFVAPPVSALPPRGLPELPFLDDLAPEPAGQPGSSATGSVARRSRSRRRGGSGETSTPPSRPEPITEPARVKGSTRLEAKKQRRREGRDGGRRRTVVTESEFLARREAVDRAMVVRSKHDRIQIAVLEDDVLVEHYVARSQEASLIGNVYLGRVQNVLPSMEAAFVDIGRGRNAVLYSGEVDWEAAAAAAEADGRGQQARRIELALKPGDRVLVQVTKDPVGHKGARLTSQISLPGRYLVYVPNGSMSGISRKLPDTERARLKRILKEVLPEQAGVIVRTAAEGATEEQLTLDVTRLANQWSSISARIESAPAPTLLHSEPDLLVKIVRDVFNEDFQRLIIEGDDARETISAYLAAVAPDLLDRVVAYEGVDSFAEFRVTEQIDKALDRKVWLPSGGSLVIDRTEAMTVVDVNTGKFVGAGGNLEETVTKNNLEAAEEIVRQLRLRDIGGIIVVDFIDMVLESNRDLVLRRLVECLSRDRTKHQVAEVTSLGLVQMTRKKIGLGLLESFSEPCEVCAGRGLIVHHEPVVKLRAPDGGSRRSRGGRGTQAPQQQPAVKNGMGPAATGAITEDVRNALARVAASTVHPHHDEHGEPVSSSEAAPRSSARSDEPSSRPSGQLADAPVTILDIPIEPATREPRSADPVAEQLLASALDALPAERTGSRRGRRGGRRAGSGGIVTPPPAADA